MVTRLAEEDDVTILHISDLHFGAHDPDKLNALERVTKEYQPHLICATGDIVDSPTRSNFELADGWLKRFSENCRESTRSAGRPLYLVPGNHDSTAYFRSSRAFEKYLKSPAEFCDVATIGDADVCIFGFDTTCFRVSGLGNNGCFSDTSRAKFEKFVDDLTRRLGQQRFARSAKVALVHHHPLPSH